MMIKQISFYTLSLILMMSLMPQAISTIPEDSFDNVKIDQIEDEYIFDFEDGKIPNDPNLITFSEYRTYKVSGFYCCYSGSYAAISSSSNNAIYFHQPIRSFSAYFNTWMVYNVSAFNVDGDLLATKLTEPETSNQFIQLESNQNMYEIQVRAYDHTSYGHWTLDYITISKGGISGTSVLDYEYKSFNVSLSLNVTIENGTTYDAYLDENLVDSQNYQNGTIEIDISKLYVNYTYTNYTEVNNTKYQYSNLTLAFHTEQNNTYTHFVNVTVYDYLPVTFGDSSMYLDYEIGTNHPIEFNISDDNPDMYYVYSNNELIFSDMWENLTSINANDFVDYSTTLGVNNYTVIFEDKDDNEIEYHLQINVLDSVNPVFTSVSADNYLEGDDFGVISFTVVDVTLDNYAILVNNEEIASSQFGENNYIEVSNEGYAVGNYTVEIIVEDRALNIAKITTSFSVMLYDNNSTNVSNNGNNTNTISETSTETTTETSTETSNETLQGNSTQSVDTSIPESAPLMNLPLMIFTGFIGLYILKRKSN